MPDTEPSIIKSLQGWPAWIKINFDSWIIIFLIVIAIDKNFVLIISIMLYIPKIGDYLKILTDEKVKDLVAISFSGHFKSTRKKLYSN